MNAFSNTGRAKSRTDNQWENTFFQFPEELFFVQVLCCHSKLLFYCTPAPDRGLIVWGGDGVYVQKLFSLNIKLAA